MSNRRLSQAKIVVLGGSGVGKSAFVVRYITKRFIGDYEANTENIYTYRVNSLRDDEIILTIVDTANCSDIDTIRDHVTTSDGLVLIYSIDDRRSLHEAHAIRAAHLTGREVNSPLVVVANKRDLVHSRTVSEREGEDLAATLDSPLYEVSVADSTEDVNDCMDELLRQILREHVKVPPMLNPQTGAYEAGKRSKLLNMKRAFKRRIARSRSDTF